LNLKFNIFSAKNAGLVEFDVNSNDLQILLQKEQKLNEF